MPGTVRYGVNLARLRREDVAWDAATGTLTVTLPPLEIAGPRIDPASVAYEKGAITFTVRGDLLPETLKPAVHVGALDVPAMQVVLRVVPLEADAWIRIVAVAASIVVAIEIHKRIRRVDRPVGWRLDSRFRQSTAETSAHR